MQQIHFLEEIKNQWFNNKILQQILSDIDERINELENRNLSCLLTMTELEIKLSLQEIKVLKEIRNKLKLEEK